MTPSNPGDHQEQATLSETASAEGPNAAAGGSPGSRRRYLQLTILVLVVGGVGAWFGGRELWADAQERAAQRALNGEDYDGARQHIERALQVHPDRFSTNLLASRIERYRRDYPEAERRLVHCKDANGMSQPLQLEFLLLRCEKGEVDQVAPELLGLVKENHAEAPAILEAMALVYMRQTRYPDALAMLDQWIERAPNCIRAYEWRGWVCNQLDRRGQAIDDYTRALELQPGRSIVRLRFAQMLIESSRHAEAIPHLEVLLQSQPDDPDVLVGLAACRIVQLRVDEARKLLEQVLAAHPDFYPAILLRGNLERGEGRYDEAEVWLRKALQLKPQDSTARYTLHLALLAQPNRQQDAEAERVRWETDLKLSTRLSHLLRAELADRPLDADLAAEAGELLMRQGEDQRALFWFHRSLQLNPHNVRAHQALAQYYSRTGDAAKAEEHRRQLGKGSR
jgi:tetratricopeptide (TPR) repeat protein